MLWEDWVEFLNCLKKYLEIRFKKWAVGFEAAKDYLVDLLLAKRGVYGRSFLNSSLAVLVAAGVLSAPIVANSYPGTDKNFNDFTPPSAVLGALTTATNETSTLKGDRGRDQVLDYKIQSGDTLSTLAEKFGISIETIKWANNLKGDSLTIGDELSIPPVSGLVYKVKPGDTIYSIAKYYRTDAQKIANFPFNDFADLETFALNIGQTLIIPDGVMPEAKPVVYLAQVTSFSAGGGSGALLWPVGGAITQYPVWYHNALDIADSLAPGIAAANDGIVEVPGFMAYGYGNHVIVDNGDGLATLYGHLAEIYVSSGQRVSRGQIIGRMGSTGRSTGAHLHFEVRRNGVIVNPLPYLK